MKLAELYTEVRADNKKYRGDLNKAESMTRRSAGRMQATFKRMAIGIGAYFGARQLFRFLRSSIKFAGIQEDLNIAMAESMKKLGTYTNSAYQDLKQFSNAMQATTIYSNEEVEALLNLGMTLGRVSGKELKDFVKMSIGMAEIMKVDVKTAAQSMAFAMQGNFARIGRYVKELDGFNTAQEKMAFLMKRSAEGFDIVTAKVKTTAGQMAQLKNELDDVNKVFGEGFIKGIQLAKTLSDLKNGAKENGETMREMGVGMGMVAVFSAKAAKLFFHSWRFVAFGVVRLLTWLPQVLATSCGKVFSILALLPGRMGRTFKKMKIGVQGYAAEVKDFRHGLEKEMDKSHDTIYKMAHPNYDTGDGARIDTEADKAADERYKKLVAYQDKLEKAGASDLEILRKSGEYMRKLETKKDIADKPKAGGKMASIAASAFGAMPIAPVTVALPSKPDDVPKKQLTALEQIVQNTKNPNPVVLQ